MIEKLTQFWDFIDKRDIDKHLMAWSVFTVTCYIIFWCMEYIWSNPAKQGLEIGAVVAAIMIPWTPVQAAVVNWYFRARTE